MWMTVPQGNLMFWFVYKFVSNQKRAWEREGGNLWTLKLVVEEREEMAEAGQPLSPLSMAYPISLPMP